MPRSSNHTNKLSPSSSLKSWVDNYPTRLAVYFPVFVTLAIVVLGTWIGTLIYHGNPSAKYVDIVFLLGCLSASATGWIQILLRDAQGFIWPVRGRAAQIWGGLWVAVCWGLALLLIWDFFVGSPR